jgi:hypothetical protein
VRRTIVDREDPEEVPRDVPGDGFIEIAGEG